MKTNSEQPTEILIREATGQDAGDVVRLISQLGEDSDITVDYVYQYLSGADCCILLAQCGDVVAGLLSYSVRADLFHAGNSLLIEELVVDAEYRGKGIGGALLEELMKRAQGLHCKEVCLAVMPDNEDAIRFYKRHGLVDEALFLERHFIL